MRFAVLLVAAVLSPKLVSAQTLKTLPVSMRSADLNVGEAQTPDLPGGRHVKVKLVDLNESGDSLRHAVRRAEVTVEVDGKRVTLISANYRLPTEVAGVRVDCAITRGYVGTSVHTKGDNNPWGLDKDARIR